MYTHTQHTYVTWLQIWTYVCVYAAHVLLRNFNLVEKSGMWDRLLFKERFYFFWNACLQFVVFEGLFGLQVHKRSRQILGV